MDHGLKNNQVRMINVSGQIEGSMDHWIKADGTGSLDQWIRADRTGSLDQWIRADRTGSMDQWFI